MENTKHDEVTIEYYKREMHQKVNGLNDKAKTFEMNIEVFIALHKFRETQDFVPSYLQKRDSISKKNRARLSEIDPLMGALPKDFNEERLCLLAKLREIRQRIQTIDSALNQSKPDAFENERDNIYKRIEEAVSYAKANKKRIEDLDERTKKGLTETKETIEKDFHAEFETLKEDIFKMLKGIRTSGSGPDETSIRSLR